MALLSNAVFEEAQDETRKKLCDVVVREKEKFLHLAQTFYNDNARTENQYLELTQAIISMVDTVVQAGDWDRSLFLKNTIKPLLQLRKEALSAQSELRRNQGLEEIGDYCLQEHELKVYVSLYQAEGHDMQKWEAQLSSIHAYMAGRPIYKHEDDVRRTIRQKVMKTSEAYAIAIVDKNKILEDGFTTQKKDRQGFELLTIELGMLSASNVIEFVHLDKRYYFYNRRLVLKEK